MGAALMAIQQLASAFLQPMFGHWADRSGEGRWMMADGIELAVPTPALAASLYARFYSRAEGDYAARVLAALRNQFGGHAVKKVEETA